MGCVRKPRDRCANFGTRPDLPARCANFGTRSEPHDRCADGALVYIPGERIDASSDNEVINVSSQLFNIRGPAEFRKRETFDNVSVALQNTLTNLLLVRVSGESWKYIAF